MKTDWTPIPRERMAERVAKDVPAGSVVNLGIGMPELVGNHFAPDDEIIVHTENGIVGSGPTVAGPLQDFDLINAGRKPVKLATGGHFVDHVDSFALVRGGHLDVTILGAFQVSASGDLANWSTGDPATLPSPGGAMDLVVGARQVFVMMNLFGKNGECRLVEHCTLPLSGSGVVTRLYTDLAVFDLTHAVPIVLDLVAGVTLSSLSEKLNMPLQACQAGIERYGS